jgi:hypothetical protein
LISGLLAADVPNRVFLMQNFKKLAGLMFALYAPCLMAQSQFTANGSIELKADYSSAAQSWSEGGAAAVGLGDGLFGEGRFGLGWSNGERLRANVEVIARAQAHSVGSAIGLSQAFVDYGDLDTDNFRLRTGFAFLPSSRENIERFWQTPYGISFSALNSWIGEEFRPLGVDFTKRFGADATTTDLAAQIFVGNDTGPALLAWRGFALHQRISVLGESLPLLNLPSLRAPDQFFLQRDDGSQPFGPDLDGRIGYTLRVRQSFAGGAHVSAAWVDNRGDRKLHDGDEYAWNTQFAIIGFDLPLSDDWMLLGEAIHGRTLMGFPPGANVNFGFDASYLTLSHSVERWTHSVRLEAFHISERDYSIGELNTQNGVSATVALLYGLDDWRFGAELGYSDIHRPGNREFQGNAQQGGTQMQVLVRRYF